MLEACQRAQIDSSEVLAGLVLVILLASACASTNEALRKKDAEVDLQWGYSQITNHDHGDARGGQWRASMSLLLLDPFELGVMLGWGQDQIDILDRATDHDRKLVMNEYLAGLQAWANFLLGSRLVPFLDITSGLAYVGRRGDASISDAFDEDVLAHPLTPFAELGFGVRVWSSADSPGGVELAVRLRAFDAWLWCGSAARSDTSVQSVTASVGFSIFF